MLNSGCQYFGKRYLNPYLGRWISPDPLAVHAPGSADLNLYAYVHGQILKNVDPIGLDKASLQKDYQAQISEVDVAIAQTTSAAQQATDAEIAADAAGDADAAQAYFEQASKLEGAASALRAARRDLAGKYEDLVAAAYGPVCGPRDVKEIRQAYATCSRAVEAIQASGAMVVPLVAYRLY